MEDPKDWNSQHHRKLHWTECHVQKCRYHLGKRRTTGFRQDDLHHYLLKPSECKVEDCLVHQYQLEDSFKGIKLDPSQQTDEETKEEFYDPEFKDPQDGGPVKHEHLHWTGCYDNDCQVHWHDKSNANCYPKRTRGLKAKEDHERVHWTKCEIDDCIYHSMDKAGVRLHPRVRKVYSKN